MRFLQKTKSPLGHENEVKEKGIPCEARNVALHVSYAELQCTVLVEVLRHSRALDVCHHQGEAVALHTVVVEDVDKSLCVRERVV